MIRVALTGLAHSIHACSGQRSGASDVEVCVLQTNRGVPAQDQSCCGCWREGQRTIAKGAPF